MPWQCSICAEFTADSRNRLVNHIGRCHRNDPNFHCICGVQNCTKTFKNYYSWRKHLKNKHDEQHTEDGPAIDVNLNAVTAAEPVQNENDVEFLPINDINVEDATRSGALYILKLQEACSLPKSTVELVISNTTSIVQRAVSVVKTEVHDCLLKADVDIQTIPGLQAILNLEENNEATNPFNNLNTESQRLSYYKEQFGLKVITCVNILSSAHDILYDSISALNVTLTYLTGTSKNCSRIKRSVP